MTEIFAASDFSNHRSFSEGLAGHFDTLPFLGRLTCQRQVLTAGEWTELELTHEVGAVGLADGAWLKLAFKFYSDWALFQTTEPTGANYVSAEYHAGPLVSGQSPSTIQALKVRFDQKGHERPFQKAVIIDVVDGYLNPGDKIVIRLGDRRQGGAGTRVQTFVEKAFRFRLFVDPLGSSKFAEVPGDCTLEIAAGEPYALQVIAPRLVGLGQIFDAIVRVDDIWGNTCRGRDLQGSLVMTAPDGTQTTEPVALAAEGWTFARISGLSFADAGEWKLEARLNGEPFVAAGVAYVQGKTAPCALSMRICTSIPTTLSAPMTRPTISPTGATSPGLTWWAIPSTTSTSPRRIGTRRWRSSTISTSPVVLSATRAPNGAATPLPAATATSSFCATASPGFRSTRRAFPSLFRMERDDGGRDPSWDMARRQALCRL